MLRFKPHLGNPGNEDGPSTRKLRIVVSAVAAVLWIVATGLLGSYFFLRAAFAANPLFGEEPRSSRAAWLILVSAGLLSLGPFGIWPFRRRFSWLVAAGILLLTGVGLALIYLTMPSGG